MTLRFEVNQAEAFRRGVDVPKSTIHIDVDPSTLSQQDRDLIADRLDGIDVCALWVDSNHKVAKNSYGNGSKVRIMAALPTFESLMEVVRDNAEKVRLELTDMAAQKEEQIAWEKLGTDRQLEAMRQLGG